MTKDKHTGLPVAGYQPQSDAVVAKVNESKAFEERLLRFLDDLAADPDLQIDRRWFSVGRTHFEQGFMAITRSVIQPGRISLPEDEA